MASSLKIGTSDDRALASHGVAPDVLSQVLASCRSERAATACFTLAAPWALNSLGVEGLLIRLARGAPYWIGLEGMEPQRVGPRDIVVLPNGGAHTVASAPNITPQPFAPLIARHQIGQHGDHPLAFSIDGRGPVTELLSLHLWMPALGEAALIAALPGLIIIREEEVAGTAALAMAAESLIDETFAQQPGWQLVAARIADLLLVHVLRRHLVDAKGAPTGWLRALQDPALARVLQHLHADPARAWTVEQMARVGLVSRTVFTERFRRCLEVTPMDYLVALRMALAAERLCNSRQSLAQVAASIGYDSDKSFARAFRRWAGETPTAYVRRRTVGA
ncbi:AraC family transcriptional regulator [Variovorax sp. J22R115]|uniref:AraC family transcriptional regulator n=1 Tax=Variovorax sp. J22R115 TaxID=3053509 RepID=UPI0025763C1F|nr:AraC family transcriptional regulator [Variovorax sp. J22R115]MDM0053843.1 AraC family transcriptional regulator [Variovorax sp. J22R115]